MGLRIVELMYNPPGSADDTEYFEILNTGTQTADLTGVKITDFSAGGYTFAGGSLAAGERIVVVKSQAAFAAAYPGVINVAAGEFSGSLANEGEIVSLRGPAPANVLIQSFTYGDQNVSGWPVEPDGNGYSLVYDGPFDAQEDPASGAPADPYEVADNWKASSAEGGSPGTDDAPIPGDYDGNRMVEEMDYIVWRRQYGLSVTPGTGADGNGDGIVDAGDYSLWRNHYVAPGAGGGGLAVAASDDESDASEAVAEPSFEFVVLEPTQSSVPLTVVRGQSVTTATDANSDLLWQVLGMSVDDEDSSDDDVDILASSDESTDANDAAEIWEDDAWLSELGLIV
jgi:hypothetical protein